MALNTDINKYLIRQKVVEIGIAAIGPLSMKKTVIKGVVYLIDLDGYSYRQLFKLSYRVIAQIRL